jgi:hypothetical protein
VTGDPAARSRAHVQITNPQRDFVLQPGDDALVLAESPGTLAPLKLNKRADERAHEPIHVPVREQAGA